MESGNIGLPVTLDTHGRSANLSADFEANALDRCCCSSQRILMPKCFVPAKAVKPLGIPSESSVVATATPAAKLPSVRRNSPTSSAVALGSWIFDAALWAFREGQANLRMALHGGGFRKHVERTDEVRPKGF